MLNRIAIVTLLILATFVGMPSAIAAGGCPDMADHLEDFAGCMAVMPGNTGTMYRGTLADLNGDGHAGLMNAMHAAMPPATYQPAYWSPNYYYGAVIPSMVSVAASQAYQGNPHATFWTWWATRNAMMYPW